MSLVGDARLAFLRDLAAERIINRGLFGIAGRKPENHQPPVASLVHSPTPLRLFSPADSTDKKSAQLTEAFVENVRATISTGLPSGAAFPTSRPNTARSFEKVVAAGVDRLLTATRHLWPDPLSATNLVQRGPRSRPKDWKGTLRRQATLADFRAYRYLWDLMDAQEADPLLRAAIGGDYLIRPDIVIWRDPPRASDLRKPGGDELVDEALLELAPTRLLRPSTGAVSPILHASVSCKETLRSDRAQNVRTEALNILRNRKGRAPHIVLVTAEPLPSRLASIAQGTGDVDSVYHVALPELRTALDQLMALDSLDWATEKKTLDALVVGERLQDFSALGLDLLL